MLEENIEQKCTKFALRYVALRCVVAMILAGCILDFVMYI